MKNIYLLFCFLPFFISAQSFEKDLYKEIDKAHLTTGILYDRVFPIADLTSGKTIASGNKILQAISELSRADYQTRFPDFNTVKALKKKSFIEGNVPLAILISEFQKIKPNAFIDGLIQRDTQGNLKQASTFNGNLFDTYSIALAGPIVEIHNGLTVNFTLPELLVINSTFHKINTIEINFGNAQFVPLSINEKKSITYTSPGQKKIEIRLLLNNGESYLLQSILEVKTSSTDLNAINNQKNAEQSVTIESTIAYQGIGESQAYTGIGEYQIFLDNQDGILDKPIILIDGFDPGDTRDIPALYQLLNFNNGTENLADEARALGYDVILLNFPVYIRNGSDIIDGGSDYIQRNAFVLAALIEEINAQKVGEEELVIIGPSMGGLISRYALRYMEQNGLNHETRLWLSFDAPHLGANIPIGFQHLFNYIAFGPLGDVGLQDVVNGLLRNPAARQMLIDHFEGHLLPGDPAEFDPTIVLPTGSPNFRNAFQAELNAMGYPQNTRNISISNGSGFGETTGTPGMNVIDYTFYPDGPDGFTRALIEVNFAPAASQTQRVSRIRSQIFIIFWLTVDESDAFSMAPAFTSGLDSAPGGLFDIAALAGNVGNNPILIEFLDNLNIEFFNFIPTLSSLAITTTNNLYTSVSENDIDVFDAFYIPQNNEPHITLTPGNVEFARQEIFLDPLSVSENLNTQLQLAKNPITNELVILGNLINAEIIVSDLSGKNIFNQSINLQNSTSIPIHLSTGLYLLSIQGETTNFKTKFIVK
ncbi:MAG: hypothetical protein CVU03_13010 [Bacteroidetes bacterium HGW-Bacteroidetes-2]|jgi:pimeloyl-ACP methyl ester carboxylesterase|nr:MAG: hypothetical protein CVU03_13010 [Bacteroidetes bacterium HGW-Bacteroidetes-2]